MDHDKLAALLAANAERIGALVAGVAEEQAVWKPTPDSWSVTEVVNHLYDEEREDFRVRLDIALHHPDQPWPPIDPEGWVVERRYNQRGLERSLERFLEARRASLVWLEELVSPNWEAVYQAPFGPITAGDLYASWVAHDLLHMRQLVELHWAYANRLSHPFNVAYAGPW